jgi:hypothetical protein
VARFDTPGLDDLVKDVEALNFTEEETDEMLLAGAKQVKKAWRAAAEKHGLKASGDMIESIDYAKRPATVDGVRCIDIYPQGKDRKGIRNAEKAFVLHYGTSSKASQRRGEKKAARKAKKYQNPGIPATHWADDADKLCESEFPVVDAMEDQFEEICKKKGLK